MTTSPMAPVDARIRIRLTADERKYLERRAELSGLSLSRYVRQRLFYSPEANRAERFEHEKYGIKEELGA